MRTETVFIYIYISKLNNNIKKDFLKRKIKSNWIMGVEENLGYFIKIVLFLKLIIKIMLFQNNLSKNLLFFLFLFLNFFQIEFVI